MSKLYNILLVLLLCVATLSVLSQKTQPDSDSKYTVSTHTADNRIVIVQEPSVKTLDPALAQDTGSARVIANIFEGLVRFKPGTAQIEPCLASSWSVSEDGLVWTFNLRRDVLFHDGTKLDSSAVKYSIDRQFNKSREKTTYADFVFAPLKTVEVADNYTVKFHLEYPYAPLLNNLAMPMAAPIVSPAAAHKNNLEANPVGTGPYTWGSKNDHEILLKVNEEYWQSSSEIKELLFLTVPETVKRVDMLLEDRADIALDLNFNQTAQLRFKGYPVFRTTGLDICYLGFYTDKKPFDQAVLRKAVALALDKDTVLNKLWPQEVRSALSTLPPTVLGYDTQIKQYKHDPNESARLLKNAGYENGISFTLITYDNSRPYTPGGGKALAEELARSLAQHGIEMKVQAYAWQDFKRALERRQGDAFLYGWISDNGDPDNFLYTLLSQNQIKSGLNITRYQNPALDALLASGRVTGDPQTRREIYYQAQQIINKDVPWVVINHSLHYAATTPRIAGFLHSPTDWPLLYGVSKSK